MKRSDDESRVDEAQSQRNKPSGNLKSEAAVALRRAHMWIQGVAWMYRFGALAYAIATFYAVLALARTDVPTTGGTVVVWLTTSLCVVMLMASMHILFRPFLWTIGVAMLASVVTMAHYFGPNPYGLAFLGSAAWAAAAWAALVPTYRFRNLIEEHKDLYVLHHSSLQTRRSLKGRSPEARHERLMAVLARATRRAWRRSTLAAAGIILLSSIGANQVLANLRPDLLEGAVVRFEDSWNRGDLDTLESLFAAKVREGEARELHSIIAGHGWDVTLPELGACRAYKTEQGQAVEYALDEGPLAVAWVLEENHWVVSGIRPPYPPIEPTLEEFVDGWTLSSPEELASFFSDETRSKMVSNIANAKAKRGWLAFPEVTGFEASPIDPRETMAVFQVEGGEVLTKWHFQEDGTWGLHGLRLPTHRIRKLK